MAVVDIQQGIEKAFDNSTGGQHVYYSVPTLVSVHGDCAVPVDGVIGANARDSFNSLRTRQVGNTIEIDILSTVASNNNVAVRIVDSIRYDGVENFVQLLTPFEELTSSPAGYVRYQIDTNKIQTSKTVTGPIQNLIGGGLYVTKKQILVPAKSQTVTSIYLKDKSPGGEVPHMMILFGSDNLQSMIIRAVSFTLLNSPPNNYQINQTLATYTIASVNYTENYLNYGGTATADGCRITVYNQYSAPMYVTIMFLLNMDTLTITE